jgi:hypothetical protein
MEKPEKMVGRHAKIEETKRERHRKGRGIREGGQRKMVGGGSKGGDREGLVLSGLLQDMQ